MTKNFIVFYLLFNTENIRKTDFSVKISSITLIFYFNESVILIVSIKEISMN